MPDHARKKLADFEIYRIWVSFLLSSVNFYILLLKIKTESRRWNICDLDQSCLASEILTSSAIASRQSPIRYMTSVVTSADPLLTAPSAVCPQPGPKSSVYDRLCDVSKYGASHRMRFDEHGKGRGTAGRKDVHTDSGYVHGYKNQNTYQKQH